ncbi:unnamed protein product [Lasius platythorax]|uniref:Uncharacterized protein n=1 Tax=Lasius platythorax TaxID=488582 RepID=A0AAV2NZ08_9HYME
MEPLVYTTEEPWLYFRSQYHYTREAVNFSRRVRLFVPPTILPGRKLREEYQHATQRCRCGDFSPGFGIYEAASFLTGGHEKERCIGCFGES